MQVVQHPDATLVQLPHGKPALVSYLLSAPGQGTIVVTCLADDGHISIIACPRGSSAVHTGVWLTEYRIHSDSLFVLDNLLVRFWGHPPKPPERDAI
jgi:hypothetical protein